MLVRVAQRQDGASPKATVAGTPVRRWSRPIIVRIGQAFPGSEKSHNYLALINELTVASFGQASLEMSNLRTKKREDSGGGYTNQTAGHQQLAPKRNLEGPCPG